MLAQDLINQDRNEEAIEHYRLALAKDPDFGKAYSGTAIAMNRLGRREESVVMWKQALAHLDRMTEREKYGTLGTYYSLVEHDYEKAVETYLTLLNKYPADATARNNLAVVYLNTLNLAKALEHGKHVVEIYPKGVTYRLNYSLYWIYTGDFERGEREARVVIEINPATPKAYLAMAMAALTRGDRAAATASYREAQTTAGPRGRSLAAMGLADMAMYLRRVCSGSNSS